MTERATTLGEAIAAKQAAREASRHTPSAFEADAELEDLGQRLDILREHDEASYRDPGLGYARQRVANYRRRKAEHERTS